MEVESIILSVSLILCVYGYSMSDIERIDSFKWDMFVEDAYDRERRRVEEELNRLVEEIYLHECCTIQNVQKYWEILCKQYRIRKEYGTKIPSTVVMCDELDGHFHELDNEVILGYESSPTAEPLPFTIGGYVVPDSFFGKKKDNRGRPKKDAIAVASAVENFAFLMNYVETPQDRLEQELDRLHQEEKLKCKRGRGRPGDPDVDRTPKTLPIPADSEVIKTTNIGAAPANISNNMSTKKKAPKKDNRGRPLGGYNIGPTALTNGHAVIIDRDIVMRKNPTLFEKYLFQYSRLNRDITTAEWEQNAERELEKLMDSLKESVNDFMRMWREVNSRGLNVLRDILRGKKYDEDLLRIINHPGEYCDTDLISVRNGIDKHCHLTYAIFSCFFLKNGSAGVYIGNLFTEESPSETIDATANKPIKTSYTGTRDKLYIQFDFNAPNVTYHKIDGDDISGRRKIIESINGIRIASIHTPEPSKLPITREQIKSIENIPEKLKTAVFKKKLGRKPNKVDKVAKSVKSEEIVRIKLFNTVTPKLSISSPSTYNANNPNFTPSLRTREINTSYNFISNKIGNNSRYIPHHDNILPCTSASYKKKTYNSSNINVSTITPSLNIKSTLSFMNIPTIPIVSTIPKIKSCGIPVKNQIIPNVSKIDVTRAHDGPLKHVKDQIIPNTDFTPKINVNVETLRYIDDLIVSDISDIDEQNISTDDISDISDDSSDIFDLDISNELDVCSIKIENIMDSDIPSTFNAENADIEIYKKLTSNKRVDIPEKLVTSENENNISILIDISAHDNMIIVPCPYVISNINSTPLLKDNLIDTDDSNSSDSSDDIKLPYLVDDSSTDVSDVEYSSIFIDDLLTDQNMEIITRDYDAYDDDNDLIIFEDVDNLNISDNESVEQCVTPSDSGYESDLISFDDIIVENPNNDYNYDCEHDSNTVDSGIDDENDLSVDVIDIIYDSINNKTIIREENIMDQYLHLL